MNAGAPLALKPKDSVRRLLTAAGVGVPDKEAYWLGFHMERFVNHTRAHGELLDLPTASENYLIFFRNSIPAPETWQVTQVKQALELFARGTEGWRWVQAKVSPAAAEPVPGPGGWILRYRIKASGANAVIASGGSAVSPAGPPVEMAGWLERLQREIRLSHYSIRTEQSYLEAVRRFLLYTGPVAEGALESSHVKRFLEHLALERQVAASTQNQAFSAILFFFKRVLGRDMGDLSDTLRAKRGERRQDHAPVAASDLGGADWERDLIKAVREKGFLYRTETTYREWAAKFAAFLRPRSPYAASGEDIGAFLSHLAVTQRAAPSTQKQALNALVFVTALP